MDRYKTKVNGGGYGKYNLGASSCALTCPIATMRQTPLTCLPLRTPGDRHHVDKQAFLWHQSTRGQTTQRTDKSFPVMGSFSGCTRMKTNESSPESVPGDIDYIKTNKCSPGTLFRVHQETNCIKTVGQVLS